MGINECEIGKSVIFVNPVNLYGCKIGDDCFIGPFVEIQNNVIIKSRTRIQSHSFICEGATIGEHCFIGHGTMFVNDLFIDSPDFENWIMHKIIIGDNVRIGSNSTILPVQVGNNVIIGAGSVVTKDIPSNTIVAGNPAKILRKVDE